MIIAIQDTRFALDQTCFYPGGGGQPSDSGFAILPDGSQVEIDSTFEDEEEVIWHVCKSNLNPSLIGQAIKIHIDAERRSVLARFHTVLHVLNTIALRWITGVQIGEEYSRIDFNLENFSQEMRAELEDKVNTVLQKGHPVTSYTVTEEEFNNRPNLLRTLDVKPPVIDGHVRVVEIGGFDAQACGGTHVDSTLEVGRFTIFRTENKGRKNKRLYIKLA
jgi:misacylated tRNA(Ala) deacylase